MGNGKVLINLPENTDPGGLMFFFENDLAGVSKIEKDTRESIGKQRVLTGQNVLCSIRFQVALYIGLQCFNGDVRMENHAAKNGLG